MASAAVAFGVLGGRLWPVISPGAAGVAAMACLGVAWTVAPKAWLEALPPARLLCASAMLFGLVTVAIATREPVR